MTHKASHSLARPLPTSDMLHPPTLVSNHHGSTSAMFFWHTHQSDNGTLGGELCSTEQGPDEAVDLFLLRIVSVIFRRNLQLLHPKSMRRKFNICFDWKSKLKPNIWMTFGHQLVCFCHHHYIQAWRARDYSLVIKLHALSSWLIPTAAVGALRRFKALPRADAASRQKCLTAFFHHCLWSKDQIKKWFQRKRTIKRNGDATCLTLKSH